MLTARAKCRADVLKTHSTPGCPENFALVQQLLGPLASLPTLVFGTKRIGAKIMFVLLKLTSVCILMVC